MKKTSKIVGTIAGLSVLAATAVFASGHGTDILHFFVRKTMVNDGVEATAAGRVEANQNKQGHANNQRLKISVSGLGTNATYTLFALVDDDTNLTSVTDFTTDGNGNAKLDFRSNGNGHGHGHGHNNLPAAVDPLSNVREFDVFNSSTQAVLTADLTVPDQLQYLIKRDISSNSVSASLRIKATTSQTQFRLTASGLVASTDYLLALNDEVVQTNTSDASGKLDITSAPTPTNILDLHSVALEDTSSNVVVSTTLP